MYSLSENPAQVPWKVEEYRISKSIYGDLIAVFGVFMQRKNKVGIVQDQEICSVLTVFWVTRTGFTCNKNTDIRCVRYIELFNM